VGVASSDEAPTAAVPTSGEPATEAVASSDEAQTEAVAISDEAQPDADNRSAQAGAEEPSAEPTATFAVSSSGEITAANTTPDDATEPTAVAAAGEEPTEASTAATAPVDEKTGDQTTEAAHATDVVPAPAPMDEPAEAAPAEAAPAATASAAARNDTAAAAPAGPADDEDEKTQVIELPVAGLTTRDLRRHPGEKPTHNIDHGGKTQVIGPGERTQVIPLLHGDETQVIKLPGQRMPPADGEKTQVIRLGTGTVEPPADRTQVLTFPAKNPPGEGATERREPAKPPSIVGEERPNPGDDPTTRIVPPDRSANPSQDSGEETTVDVARGKRIMTVTNLERPADEVADDTRRLVPPPPPTQRHPEDETT
jgi:hypothetical protein